MIESRELSAEEVKKWREGKTLVTSMAGVLPSAAPHEVVESPYQSPLHPRETYDAMMSQMLDRQNFPAAIQWLRATMPAQVSHLSDSQIRDILEQKIRDAVTQVTRDKGVHGPVLIGVV